ncbi:MAG: hypothetical protein EPN93_14880 [Spirochaetes bacterium]|nr:MAG: hypothetical protein EPN93_14880 [Spirochaetota bacterium]
MRDDAELLLRSLSEILTAKLSLLRAIRAEETNGRYYLKSEDTDRLAQSIDRCTGLVADTDVLDFDAAAVRASLARVLGVQAGGLHPFLRTVSGSAVEAYLAVQADILEETRALKDGHDRLVEEIESRFRSMENERRSLAALGRVLGIDAIRDPRDPSS